MNRSLTALWLALGTAIVAIVVLAQFWITQRERSSRERVREILAARLVPVNQAIKRVMDQYSLELERELTATDLSSPSECVELKRSPLIRTLVVVDREQQMLSYPKDVQNTTSEDRLLIEEALQLLRDRFPKMPSAANGMNTVKEEANRFPAQQIPSPQSPTPQIPSPQIPSPQIPSPQIPAQQMSPSDSSQRVPSTSRRVAQSSLQVAPSQNASDTKGPYRDLSSILKLNPSDSPTDNALITAPSNWLTWYHRRGLMIGYLGQQGTRWQAVAVLPRARWMADVVAALAALSDADANVASSDLAQQSLRQLVDVEGKVIHQWSALPQSQWSDLASDQPHAEIEVSTPLEGWRLREFATATQLKLLQGDNLRMPVWLAVGGISLSLMLSGLLVTLNIRRQMRLAQQRVSFVNQVSHELRTPLTNICMYADLIAQSLEREESDSPEHTQQSERLWVIRSESQRLTRLVNNVLEFAKPVPLRKLQCTPEIPDQIVAETLATFEPKLAELGFEVVRKLNCGNKHLLDRSVVEQVLVNLIGNAEKYAACGKHLCVETMGDEHQFELRVSDRGPGVPARMREQIFKPFVRMTDRLEDPAGTGIGLTIARDLARRHGGDCQLIDSPAGASFRCTFAAPRTT